MGDWPLTTMASLPILPANRKPVLVKFQRDIDFISLFESIKNEFDTCFLFESQGENTYEARYSVLGFSPISKISGKKNSITIDGKEYPSKNPYYDLREILPQNNISSSYAGGLVGYLSYESMMFFEKKLKLKIHQDFPLFSFCYYDEGLIYDKYTGQTIYFYNNRDNSSRIHSIIDSWMRSTPTESKNPKVKSKGYSKSKEQHHDMVMKALEEIKAGNTFQCQIGFREDFSIDGDPFPIYKTLREINPSPHMYYIKEGDRVLLGASPELLFRLRQGEMESFPLAGTIHRGKTPEEDLTLARQLLNDPKEIAEHNMLIDLHRNDLGRVASFGTVKVRRKFDLKKFSHVQHISSEVVGILKNDEDMFSGLASSFPAGTLSGAPKIESMKIIYDIEGDSRGPYGGAVGHFGLNGDCTFAIPIRSFFVNGKKGFLRASGGIVYDSNPSSEYQEILNKMASVKKALERFY
jgi:anthranilate synthase component 1